MSDLVVRAATADDATAIAAVHVCTWQEAYAHVLPEQRLRELSIERGAAYWREQLVAPATSTFVVERSGEIVGFAHVGASRDEPGTGELYTIYVLPASWGAGAGRALMDEALAALRAAGFAEATLWVLEDNPRARRFYEQAGWSLDGASRSERFLGVEVVEVRYRIRLGG